MSPGCIVRDIKRWQQTPASINLRVIFIDLGDDEKDGGNTKGKSTGGNQRIGTKIELEQVAAAEGLDEVGKEVF